MNVKKTTEFPWDQQPTGTDFVLPFRFTYPPEFGTYIAPSNLDQNQNASTSSSSSPSPLTFGGSPFPEGITLKEALVSLTYSMQDQQLDDDKLKKKKKRKDEDEEEEENDDDDEDMGDGDKADANSEDNAAAKLSPEEDRQMRRERIALHYAAEANNLEEAKKAFEADPKRAALQLGARGTPVHIVAEKGNEDIMALLLGAQSEGQSVVTTETLISRSSFKALIPICIAATEGHVGIVKQLIAKAKELNCLDVMMTDKMEPLIPIHSAIIGGNIEIASLFLDNGAITRSEQTTALHIAALCGTVQMLELLIERGCHVSWPAGLDGETPLHRAALRGHTDCVRTLLKHGAQVNAKDTVGSTPLHAASFFGRIDAAGAIIEAGGDPQIQNNIGATPFRVHREVKELTWVRVTTQNSVTGRTGHSATRLGVKLFVWGGNADDSYFADLAILDTDTMVWNKPAQTAGKGHPEPRSFHSATLVNNRDIYVFGGTNGQSTKYNDLWVLDTTTLEWRQLETKNAPAARSGHTANLYGNFLYIIGGYNGKQYLNDIQMLDLTTLEWSELKPTGDAPTPRAWHTTTQVRAKFFIVGGSNSTRTFDDVHVFDPTVHSYFKAPITGAVPYISGHATLVIGTKLYCVAGGIFKSNLADIVVIDTETNETITIHTKQPQTKSGSKQLDAWKVERFNGHSLNLIGNRIVCFGGYTASTPRYSSTVYTMNIDSRVPLAADLRSALINGEFADVVITFPKEANQSLRAHSAILAARSPRLKDMLVKSNQARMDTERSEAVSPITIAIEDIPYVIFSSLVSFCYTDTVANVELKNVKSLLQVVHDYMPDSYRRMLACFSCKGEIPSTLGHDLQALIGSSLFSDATFSLDDDGEGGPTRVPFHKALITARCAQFQAMYLSGMKESTEGITHVPGVQYGVFKLFLEFLYTDQVTFKGVTPNDVIELMGLADQYTMDYLKELCESELLKYVDEENVVVLYQQAAMYHADKLRAECCKYLLRNFERAERGEIASFSELSEELRDELGGMRKEQAAAASEQKEGTSIFANTAPVVAATPLTE